MAGAPRLSLLAAIRTIGPFTVNLIQPRADRCYEGRQRHRECATAEYFVNAVVPVALSLPSVPLKWPHFRRLNQGISRPVRIQTVPDIVKPGWGSEQHCLPHSGTMEWRKNAPPRRIIWNTLEGKSMPKRENATRINKVRMAETPMRSWESEVIAEQFESRQHGLGELPNLVAEVVEDCLSAFRDDIRVDLELALERAFAEGDRHYSPYGLVDGLNEHRAKGYQLFSDLAKPYWDDPDVAAAEQSLFTLANSPIRPGAVKRNRRELDGWMAITYGTFEDDTFNHDGSLRKDIVLRMAQLVVLWSDAEVPPKPVDRVWPAFDAEGSLPAM